MSTTDESAPLVEPAPPQLAPPDLDPSQGPEHADDECAELVAEPEAEPEAEQEAEQGIESEAAPAPTTSKRVRGVTTATVTIPEKRSQRKRTVNQGLGSLEVDSYILRELEKRPAGDLLPSNTMFRLTTDSKKLPKPTPKLQKLFEKPEYIAALTVQKRIETPSFRPRDPVEWQAVKDGLANGTIDKSTLPDMSELAYTARHRKFDLREKRQRNADVERLKHTHFKLRERRDQLLQVHDVAYFTLPGQTPQEGERRRKQILDIVDALVQKSSDMTERRPTGTRGAIPPQQQQPQQHLHPQVNGAANVGVHPKVVQPPANRARSIPSQHKAGPSQPKTALPAANTTIRTILIPGATKPTLSKYRGSDPTHLQKYRPTAADAEAAAAAAIPTIVERKEKRGSMGSLATSVHLVHIPVGTKYKKVVDSQPLPAKGTKRPATDTAMIEAPPPKKRKSTAPIPVPLGPSAIVTTSKHASKPAAATSRANSRGTGTPVPSKGRSTATPAPSNRSGKTPQILNARQKREGARSGDRNPAPFGSPFPIFMLKNDHIDFVLPAWLDPDPPARGQEVKEEVEQEQELEEEAEAGDEGEVEGEMEDGDEVDQLVDDETEDEDLDHPPGAMPAASPLSDADPPFGQQTEHGPPTGSVIPSQDASMDEDEDEYSATASVDPDA